MNKLYIPKSKDPNRPLSDDEKRELDAYHAGEARRELEKFKKIDQENKAQREREKYQPKKRPDESENFLTPKSILTIILSTIVLGFWINSCSDDKGVYHAAPQKKSKISAGGFTIPTDSKASYRMELVQKLEADKLLVITYRDGPSGESYAAREIWCNRRVFRYLAEGENVQELVARVRQYGETISYVENPMSGLVEGSISWYIVNLACG